jgi:hypothetical protein
LYSLVLILPQIKNLRSEIANVIRQQEMQALEVQNLLDQAVKQTLSEEIKAHIQAMVASEVKERVTHQVRNLPCIVSIFLNCFSAQRTDPGKPAPANQVPQTSDSGGPAKPAQLVRVFYSFSRILNVR